MELGARRPFDAVVGPQRLRAVFHLDGLEGLPAGMAAGERGVPLGMPVLGQDHMRKTPRQAVDRRHDGVALWHGKRTARAEIELRVGDDQDLAIIEGTVHLQASLARRDQIL